MRIRLRRQVPSAIVGLSILVVLSFNGPLIAQSKSILPVRVEVPFVPSPVIANGKTHVVYEVYLTNFWRKNLKVERVEVFDQRRGVKITELEENALTKSVHKPHNPNEEMNVQLIESGRVIVVFIWLSFEGDIEIPDRIYHRISLAVGSDLDDKRHVDGGDISIGKQDAVVLSPPFRKGYWAQGSGPSNDSDHRRSILAVDGQVWLSQRFAFDAMKIGDNGKITEGDLSNYENWKSYGEDLLAVANGSVSLVVDGIPDNVPLSPQRAVAMSRGTHVGNCILLDIGNGRYAFYAHLKSGSIPFEIGDHVVVGDVVGKIGNSGNSDAPHLHFSVNNANDPYSGEGLPFVFKSFDVIDIRLPNDDEFLTNGVPAEDLREATRSRRELEMPIGDPILFFD